DFADFRELLPIARRVASAFHRGEDAPRDVLEGHVDVWHETRRFRHQFEDRGMERFRIRVEEADPRERGLPKKRLDEPREAGPAEAEILSVARRVLRDEDELPHALRLEALRLPHERFDRAR